MLLQEMLAKGVPCSVMGARRRVKGSSLHMWDTRFRGVLCAVHGNGACRVWDCIMGQYRVVESWRVLVIPSVKVMFTGSGKAGEETRVVQVSSGIQDAVQRALEAYQPPPDKEERLRPFSGEEEGSQVGQKRPRVVGPPGLSPGLLEGLQRLLTGPVDPSTVHGKTGTALVKHRLAELNESFDLVITVHGKEVAASRGLVGVA